MTPPGILDDTPGGGLVVGLGSPDRGDDAVGPTVARAVAALGLPGVQVAEHEDPTALIDLWSGCTLSVVVDAVCADGEPGSLVLRDTGPGGRPLSQSTWSGRGGTHAFGLGAAVELARALNKLPERVVLIGIEAATFEHGAPLSAPVAAAVPRAVELVLCQLRAAAPTVERGSDVSR